MPWEETTVMNEKERFVSLHEMNFMTMSELCRRFKISRVSGYKLLNNYKKHGEKALQDLPKAHLDHPLKTPKEVEDDILRFRGLHKTWGAKKIRHLMLDDWEADSVPSVTTVNGILKRHGLVQPRKPRINRIGVINPHFDPANPNDIWSTDFKGKFRMKNHEYCNPLTIADSKSRIVFAVEALERPTTELCIPVFERVFRENGLPLAIHSDNGSPFGCVNSLRRMTHLSAWFMDLGITPVYSDPGCPTQNGRHERMHRDLKSAATRPAGTCLADQQCKFDKFIREFNTIRPHEALDMRRPAQVHVMSTREYHGRIYDWDYKEDLTVRMVSRNGAIRWKTDDWIMITSALNGKFVGMKEVEDGVWELYYRHVLLGYYSEQTRRTYEVETFKL